MPPSIERSAPPEKPSLPEVTTAPLIEASAVICSTNLPISSTTSALSTFIERPGESQVTRATPSASISKRKCVKLMARLRSRVDDGGVEPQHHIRAAIVEAGLA